MNLYVGNLSWGVTTDDLKQAFGAYGEVTSAQVIMDKMTGKSRGFGFVEMPNAEQGQAAINAMNGRDLKGRALDDLKPGGLGTHFMHALTDLVQFATPPAGAGNRLLLTKRLARGPGDCSESVPIPPDPGAAGR